MKALPASKVSHNQFTGVRLYRDDIEAIVGLMKHEGLQVVISDSRFEYESVDELSRNAGSSPRELSVEGKRQGSYGSVSVRRSGKYWYVSTTQPDFRQLATELEGIVRKRQSRLDALPLYGLWTASLLLFFLGGLLKSASAIASTLSSTGAILAVLTATLGSYWILYPGLVLKFPHEAGFVSRNRDAIILLVVGALIGSVSQRLLEMLPKAP